MSIAGVIASAFLLFGRKKKYFFLQFKNYNEYTETRNILGKLETKIFYFTSTKTRNKNIFLIFKTVVNMHKRETKFFIL